MTPLSIVIQNILVNGKFIPEPGSEGEKQWKQAGKPV
jgi:hypothetical protein